MTAASVAPPKERPSLRVSFGGVIAGMLGVAALAFVGGRFVYERYGQYRPLALAKVPSEMAYRARVELGDEARVAALRPLLEALDPRGTRRGFAERELGTSVGSAIREVAFGIGNTDAEFVLALGGPRHEPGRLSAAACRALELDGTTISAVAGGGCRVPGRVEIRETGEGVLVVASDEKLLNTVLSRTDLGDRLGFSGPSVRGSSPELESLRTEAKRLSGALLARLP